MRPRPPRQRKNGDVPYAVEAEFSLSLTENPHSVCSHTWKIPSATLTIGHSQKTLQLRYHDKSLKQRATWPKSKISQQRFKQRASVRQRFFPNITSSRSCPFLCEQGKSCVSTSTTASALPSQAPPAARDAAASCAHFVYVPPF